MIIRSLLDTDLYKFTMMQVVLHHFPGAHVEYRFKCRNAGVDLVPFIEEIRAEIRHLCTLRFTDTELDYLRGMRFIKSDFVDFLGLFHLNEKYIDVRPAPSNDGQIEIVIAGPWLHTIMFEVPVLAIVNEVFFSRTQTHPQWEEGKRRLTDKLASLKRPGLEDCRIADYGTRRRFSHTWHEHVLLETHAQLGAQYAGTSNVYFAMKHGMTPLGTMAHEYLQACQALGPRLRDSQTLRWKPGPRNIAATSASRCRIPTALTPSCAISTCSSASSSTAFAMILATRSSGASACSSITTTCAPSRSPRR